MTNAWKISAKKCFKLASDVVDSDDLEEKDAIAILADKSGTTIVWHTFDSLKELEKYLDRIKDNAVKEIRARPNERN